MKSASILPAQLFFGLLLSFAGCDQRHTQDTADGMVFASGANLLGTPMPQRKVFGVHDASGLPPLMSGEVTSERWLRPDRFFPRFATSLAANGEPVVLTEEGGRVRASAQWVLVVGKPAFSIRPDEVNSALAGFTLGIDVVDEDLYAGRAWVVARAADGWASLSTRSATSTPIRAGSAGKTKGPP